MTSHFSAPHQTLLQLLLRSIKVTAPSLREKTINSLIWSALNIIVFAFIMPTMGLDKNFGIFIAVTMPISCAFFSAIASIYILLSDITNDGSNLQYELTLPLPQWLAFAKYAFEIMYQSLISSILILPMGKMLLWTSFSLAYFSFVKFYFLLTIAALFFGFFAIFIASITKDMYGLDNIWTRIIFPMWFLGGFQFPWLKLYGVSPVLAYISLLNPLTYALEGGRAAALDPAASLPYWTCIGALIFFTVLFGYLGIQNLKKRLDCL